MTEVLAVVNEVLAHSPRVLKDPAAAVGICQLGDSAINISIAPWVKVEDFGPAQGELYHTLVERFKTHNISIPYPQREVRHLGEPTANPTNN